MANHETLAFAPTTKTAVTHQSKGHPMRVGITGSWKANKQDHGLLESDLPSFESACRQIGLEMVAARASIVVGSDRPTTADRPLVESYLTGDWAPQSIRVIRPADGKQPFQDLYSKNPDAFLFIHNDEKSWRFSRSRFIAEVDTMLTIGGGVGTYQVGHEIMTLTEKRLIPIGSFGGASKRLLGKLLNSQSFRDTDRLTRLNSSWVPSLAPYVVALAGEKQQGGDNEPAAKPVVHVSYAWGGESEALVDQLETKFTATCTFRRDRAAMRPGDWISKFIAEIGQSQCVLVVLSDKYLKSRYCMRELLYLHQSSLGDKAAMLQRIVPIVLGDAKIEDAVDRLNVPRHWKAERERLELATQGLDLVAWGEATRNEWLMIQQFEHHSADMLAWVADVLMPRGAAAVSAGNFQAVVDLLQRRLKS